MLRFTSRSVDKCIDDVFGDNGLTGFLVHQWDSTSKGDG